MEGQGSALGTIREEHGNLCRADTRVRLAIWKAACTFTVHLLPAGTWASPSASLSLSFHFRKMVTMRPVSQGLS